MRRKRYGGGMDRGKKVLLSIAAVVVAAAVIVGLVLFQPWNFYGQNMPDDMEPGSLPAETRGAV